MVGLCVLAEITATHWGAGHAMGKSGKAAGAEIGALQCARLHNSGAPTRATVSSPHCATQMRTLPWMPKFRNQMQLPCKESSQ